MKITTLLIDMEKQAITSHELAIYSEIQNRIHTIRGVQVMLDSDLAMFYNVEVRRLNEQVNATRNGFPNRSVFN